MVSATSILSISSDHLRLSWDLPNWQPSFKLHSLKRCNLAIRYVKLAISSNMLSAFPELRASKVLYKLGGKNNFIWGWGWDLVPGL